MRKFVFFVFLLLIISGVVFLYFNQQYLPSIGTILIKESREDISNLSKSYYANSSNADIENFTPSTEVPSISIQPESIIPGDPIFIRVSGDSGESSTTKIIFDSKSLPVFMYEGKASALYPIDLNDKVTEHKVTVTLASGEVLTKNIHINERPKIEMPLGIPESLGGNTREAVSTLLKNLAKENQVIINVKSATTSLWTKAFEMPVKDVRITDEYGYDRDTVGSTIPHKGTDFGATEGTEIFAMNDGLVRIARPFIVYGNAIIIDHGLGVQTLYMHLSKLNVKEGDRVKRGDLIGLSGKTGYAEGPHLHISIKINGISIDPMTFMEFFK